MKLTKYIGDKIIIVITFLFFLFFLFLTLCAFKIETSIILVCIISVFLFFTFALLYEYFRKKWFYQSLKTRLEELDQKYFITELLETPNFLEGKIFIDTVYEITKSMNDTINQYKHSLEDFKEYIELWIHEVKIPMSSMELMLHNHPTKNNMKLLSELHRIEEDVEQTLYYVRSENAEKDYLLKRTTLQKIVANVIKKNKENFIAHHIKLELNNLDFEVTTDTKWMEFIVSQILSNSLKYRKEDATIKIRAIEKKDQIILEIEDNGIGMASKDIDRVFDKTFTGENGRTGSSSTGMGLYLCKKLCSKLGHQILIYSKQDVGTTVKIVFGKNEFVEVIK